MSGLPTPQTAPPTSHASPSASSPNVRKERGAIAAQACDTCRVRKQRCDEQRPKCSTCQRFKLECNYREPVPTKKDKTLTEILDRLTNLGDRLGNLENKVDVMGQTIGQTIGRNQQATLSAANPAFSAHPQADNYAVPPAASDMMQTDYPASQLPYHTLPDVHGSAASNHGQYKYVSSVHSMLAWPAIQQLFASIQQRMSNVDLGALARGGVAHMLGVDGHGVTEHVPFDRNPDLVANLTWDYVERVSKAYFDSINLISPILDRHSFMLQTLPTVFRKGFTQGIDATITFFVLALGEVALAGSDGAPLHIYDGRASGIRGGTTDHPPGFELFNEGRSRMGYHLTECSLENVQVFALASAYYGSCFYPMDFWRMTASASQACQSLIASKPAELEATSPRLDLIRRVFWYCSIMETMVHLELGYPLSGLEKMESTVGLPIFTGSFSKDDVENDEESHFYLTQHFAAQIVLRRLIIGADTKLSQEAATPSSGEPVTPFNPPTGLGGINPVAIQTLVGELEQWRGMLPSRIRWQEDSPGAFPDADEAQYAASLSLHTPTTTPISPVMPIVPAAQVPNTPAGTPPLMFTTDLDAPPARYSYALDVQVAMVRSKYYYAKYLLYRPFLYKALHHPEAITQDDAVGVAQCLKSCLKWPIAMSPTCKHKRLIPCLWFFTQNFFGILVLLHLSTQVPILRTIRNNLCGERYEMDASETVGLYLDWLRDLKAIDIGTAWHWEVAKTIYGLE
ncbi:hypothetical protein QBC35DRAFT_494533 [Podospora australis]|uniref:Zn(2)-C6 fungal-type domain-containing protein n=1 Tax=Podospora australis TaxID=1536484 RepID=A0AAN6WVM9_9PEZI|nr:hypothetical protein QBC35DRAFT_494533 [Podospora australis]